MSDGDRGARLAVGDLAALLVGIVLAIILVGVVAYSGGRHAAFSPDSGSDPNQRQSAAAIERSIEPVADAQAREAATAEYQAPCSDGEYNNRSDLCAQWYAARAARDAADSAYWAVFWTVVSLGVSFLGLVALLITIRQGREANEIARQLGRAEIRAYPTIEGATVECDRKNSCLTVGWKVSNLGATPIVSGEMVGIVTLFIDEKTTEHVVSMPLGPMAKGEHPLSKVTFASAKIDPEAYRRSAAVHVEMAIFAIDVFDDEIVGYRYFSATVPPGYHLGPEHAFPMPNAAERIRILDGLRLRKRTQMSIRKTNRATDAHSQGDG